MKKRLLCFLLVLATVFLVACGNSSTSSEKNDSEENKDNKQQEIIDQLINEISLDGIKFTTGEPEQLRLETRVRVVAQIPNYTELFIAAMGEEDIEKAVAKAVNQKEYTTVEYSGYATVETDYNTGSEVVKSDELIKSFMEEELVKAINAVLEKEAAQK
ncbi:MAG: hypothetical protein E7387_00285 [Ruminococcaceae bacterium]|nr:hypothetical protein [Oscillospiraceae bacterium]